MTIRKAGIRIHLVVAIRAYLTGHIDIGTHHRAGLVAVARAARPADNIRPIVAHRIPVTRLARADADVAAGQHPPALVLVKLSVCQSSADAESRICRIIEKRGGKTCRRIDRGRACKMEHSRLDRAVRLDESAPNFAGKRMMARTLAPRDDIAMEVAAAIEDRQTGRIVNGHPASKRRTIRAAGILKLCISLAAELEGAGHPGREAACRPVHRAHAHTHTAANLRDRIRNIEPTRARHRRVKNRRSGRHPIPVAEHHGFPRIECALKTYVGHRVRERRRESAPNGRGCRLNRHRSQVIEQSAQRG